MSLHPRLRERVDQWLAAGHHTHTTLEERLALRNWADGRDNLEVRDYGSRVLIWRGSMRDPYTGPCKGCDEWSDGDLDYSGYCPMCVRLDEEFVERGMVDAVEPSHPFPAVFAPGALDPTWGAK